MTQGSGGREPPGLWLRRLREAAGLTREELAERSGLGVRTIGDLERGRTQKPYPRSIRMFTDALGLPGTAGDELIACYRGAGSGLAGQADDGSAPGSLLTSAGGDEIQPAVAPAAVPRQLPPAVGHFVGRTAELVALTTLLEPASGMTGARSGAVVISAIGGTAGVGKTALAVHWAHQAADQFPDGQLYVNLRGYDPDLPMTAADALAGFLRALGVAGQDIPAEADERAARYRTLLAGRRMLVILDNASDVEQVRLLLPGNPACVVLVTSRDSLPGLVARHGAVRLDLDLLSPGDASALLRALVGGRAEADPGAAEALAGRCARLPLALRVAAEYAVAHPALPLARLAAELGGQDQQLDLLDAGGDPRTAVRAVFSWSYQNLDARVARAFRLLGLFPGSEFDRYSIAALTATSLETASQLLGQLARAYLVQPVRPGCYGLHDLLRSYAAEQAGRDETEPGREAALTRLFDYFLCTAAAAMDTLNPAERHRRPRIGPSDTPSPPVTEPAAARNWLDAHRATLVAVTAYSSVHGWPDHTTRLAATLYRYLDTGHPADALAVHTQARHAARQTRDRAAEATALTSLGTVYWQQGRYSEAADHHLRALALYRETGDRSGQARALTNLGVVDWQQGRYQQAADHHLQALALCREVDDPIGQSRALGNLGTVDERLGRYQQAARRYRQALALSRESGDWYGEAHVLADLGTAVRRLGRYPQASGHLLQALALFRETGDRAGEAQALTELGLVDAELDRYQRAIDRHQQAHALCRQISNRTGEAEALNGLGEALLATGRHDQACAQHTAALELACQVGAGYEQARAHQGLARAHSAVGDLDRGRHHWRQALTHYTDLGLPEARHVHAHLAALAGPASPPGVARD